MKTLKKIVLAASVVVAGVTVAPVAAEATARTHIEHYTEWRCAPLNVSTGGTTCSRWVQVTKKTKCGYRTTWVKETTVNYW